MKQAAICLLAVLLLTGCSGGSDPLETGLALRSRLLQSTGCTFDAHVAAEYGDRVDTFSLRCQGDPAGELTFTITAPDSIAGITGSVSQEGGKLTFDGTALHFDTLAQDQVSPVAAPWILLSTLRGGYLTSAGAGQTGIRLTLDDSYAADALHLDVWLDRQNLPCQAEILYQGKRIVSLAVENFTIV